MHHSTCTTPLSWCALLQSERIFIFIDKLKASIECTESAFVLSVLLLHVQAMNAKGTAWCLDSKTPSIMHMLCPSIFAS